MFAQLPERIKQEVLYHLQKDNFRQAKAIHDAWLETAADNQNPQFEPA